jgi:hypothetical protein
MLKWFGAKIRESDEFAWGVTVIGIALMVLIAFM